MFNGGVYIGEKDLNDYSTIKLTTKNENIITDTALNIRKNYDKLIVDNNAFILDLLIYNNLRVLGETYLNNDVRMYSDLYIKDGVSVNDNALSVTGKTTLNNQLTKINDTDLDKTLEVIGTSWFNGDMSVVGEATFNKSVAIERNLSANQITIIGDFYPDIEYGHLNFSSASGPNTIHVNSSPENIDNCCFEFSMYNKQSDEEGVWYNPLVIYNNRLLPGTLYDGDLLYDLGEYDYRWNGIYGSYGNF
jgi:hypothetical protein